MVKIQSSIKKSAIGLGLILTHFGNAEAQNIENEYQKDKTSYDIHKIENPFNNTKSNEINFTENCDSTYIVDMQDLYKSLENVNVDSEYMEEFTISLAKEAKNIGVKFDIPNNGSKKQKLSSYVTMGFYTPSEDNLHIRTINNKYTLAHELIHKLNNKAFPNGLEDVLSPENRLISKCLDETFATDIGAFLEDESSNKDINSKNMQEFLTNRIACNFVDFFFNPNEEQKNYLKTYKDNNNATYSNNESPLYNDDYSSLFNIDSDSFTKFLADKYSNIITGYKIIDADKFMRKVNERRNHYKQANGITNNLGLLADHVFEMNIKCEDVKSIVPDVLEMKDNNIERIRKKISKIKNRTKKMDRNLEIMKHMLDKKIVGDADITKFDKSYKENLKELNKLPKKENQISNLRDNIAIR